MQNESTITESVEDVMEEIVACVDAVIRDQVKILKINDHVELRNIMVEMVAGIGEGLSKGEEPTDILKNGMEKITALYFPDQTGDDAIYSDVVNIHNEIDNIVSSLIEHLMAST